MYKDGQKALLMANDTDLRNAMETYLHKRYNLETDSVDGLIEVIHRIGDDCPYELVILDEAVEGLAAASHALKKIKDECVETNVLFLSDLLEMREPYNLEKFQLPPEFEDDDFRERQSDAYIDKRISAQQPVMKSTSLEEVYHKVCRRLVEEFRGDCSICTILRLDEKPVIRGTVVEEFPGMEMPYEFQLKGTGHLQQLVDYFKPIHIPDLNKEKAFRKELEEKFSGPFGSALLLPMQMLGRCIGFVGVFTREKNRLYNLVDLDICQRLADTATVLIIAIFSIKHENIKIKHPEEQAIP
jgi:hypothetical protein